MTRISAAVVTTQNGSRYLQQLCKHFAHKVEVRFDAERGEAALPGARARFEAVGGALRIELLADDATGLARGKAIIDDHLVRFAFREQLGAPDWEDRS
ncbi:MAG: DUF2218 domain-containing protein [Pseudomonadota bacterium]